MQTLMAYSETSPALSPAGISEHHALAPAALVVQRVSKWVDGLDARLHILQDVSFELARGQSLAIVGASGSGKSTLLALLAGLDVPSEGKVELCGQDLGCLSEDDRAAFRAMHLGFVFQSFQLLSHLSALENVMLPLELRGVRQARAPAQAMLERVGLGKRLHHRPIQLSGGEQQRVALARAFVMQPDVLMADEPTGSLDHATGAEVMALMFALNAECGTTLVLVTHDATIAARCGHQLRLHAGQVQGALASRVAGP